ncbi:MAG: hypothetical protein DRO87_09590, partial [Candidatus Thorarchaeota archaeon]
MHAVIGLLIALLLAYPTLVMMDISATLGGEASETGPVLVKQDRHATMNPGAAEPLKANIMENPSFEDWAVDRPDGYSPVSTSPYRHFDWAYSGSGVTGNYAGVIEAQGSQHESTNGQIFQQCGTTALIKPGISLTLDWNTLANPDLSQGAYAYITISTRDNMTSSLNLHYVVSYDVLSFTNGTSDTYFLMNESLNQWNSLDRNITEDFISAYGSGALSDSQYVEYLWLRAFSPTNAVGHARIAFDNVVLTNGTYSGWISNGDFETGNGWAWWYTASSMGTIEQSTDCTDGTHSLSLSVPESRGSGGYAYVSKYFDYPGGYFAHDAGMTVFDLDWKYNDSPGAGQYQYSYLRVNVKNSTASHLIYIYFGTHDGTLGEVNTTTQSYFKMPGFGVKDVWQHSRLDLQTYMSSIGCVNMSLYGIQFNTYSSAAGSSVSLLIDDFNIVTYPLGDPGFEVDWHSDFATPFAGWRQWLGDATLIHRT